MKKINEEIEQKIINKYLNENISTIEIAKEYNVSHVAIINVLKKHNIQRKKKWSKIMQIIQENIEILKIIYATKSRKKKTKILNMLSKKYQCNRKTLEIAIRNYFRRGTLYPKKTAE